MPTYRFAGFFPNTHRVARNPAPDVVFARKHGPIRSLGSGTSATGETSTVIVCAVGFFLLIYT